MVPGDDGAPSPRNAWEMAITFSKIEVALPSLCVPAEPSQISCAVLGTASTTATIGQSPFPKKWAMVVMCLHNLTLGQSGQSQDCCYALAGALSTTCAKTEYCQVNYDLVDKVLCVQSIDIAQYSKAPR